MPVTASNPFKWRHYAGGIILWCVRWYLRVQIYGPELDQRCRAHLKRTNKSYRVDETYIRIKGKDRYLYRAVDSTGQTIDFLLTAKRDAAAAKRFFRKTLLDPANPQPQVINVDKNRAYPAAVKELKVEGTLRRRARWVGKGDSLAQLQFYR